MVWKHELDANPKNSEEGQRHKYVKHLSNFGLTSTNTIINRFRKKTSRPLCGNPGKLFLQPFSDISLDGATDSVLGKTDYYVILAWWEGMQNDQIPTSAH